jgi:malonyl-CoA/methylmalonyl-CoA synthetase
VKTLLELIDERWPADGSRVFIKSPDGTRITYGDAHARSAQLASALVSIGVRPGDRVAVQIEKSPLAIMLYLACLRAGAVLVPMNPAYTEEEVAYLLGDAEPAVVVRDPSRTTFSGLTMMTADASGRGSMSDAADACAAGFEAGAPGPDDVAAILYTSGTTGRPKGAMLTHANLSSNALALHKAWGFGPNDVLLHALPVFHTHGLFVATNCVLANGTGMVFLPRFDVDAVLAHLPRCTVFMGVPTYYTRLLADDRLDGAACRNIRLFVSGSAPLPASTHEAFRARTGEAILERYGMTETSMITSNPLQEERRPGTVGKPLPGVTVRVRDHDTGSVAERDVVGDIEVAGPNVFAGYWRRPELATTEFTVDGFFRTGDVGAFDRDGYLRIVGRSKDLIISGGLNVYPKEVEDVLDGADGVVESAVVGVPDEDYGEAVVAAVVAEDGHVLDEAALRSYARERLAPFKVPKRVQVVAALPRNAMGKVEKARLREDFTGPIPE